MCITTPHETHFNLLKQAIKLSLPVWVEKPLVISNKELIDIRREMMSSQLTYAIGYNSSSAPWPNFMKSKINFRKTNISMTINAGELPLEHWLLDENTCGGNILENVLGTPGLVEANAQEHLGSSFSLEKSIGFQKWIKKNSQ